MEAVVIIWVPLSLLGFRSGSSTSVATLSSKIEAFRECSGPDIPWRPSLPNFTLEQMMSQPFSLYVGLSMLLMLKMLWFTWTNCHEMKVTVTSFLQRILGILLIGYISWVLANIMTESFCCFWKCNKNSWSVELSAQNVGQIIIFLYTHRHQELIEVGEQSWQLIKCCYFLVKVMVCHVCKRLP